MNFRTFIILFCIMLQANMNIHGALYKVINMGSKTVGVSLNLKSCGTLKFAAVAPGRDHAQLQNAGGGCCANHLSIWDGPTRLYETVNITNPACECYDAPCSNPDLTITLSQDTKGSWNASWSRGV